MEWIDGKVKCWSGGSEHIHFSNIAHKLCNGQYYKELQPPKKDAPLPPQRDSNLKGEAPKGENLQGEVVGDVSKGG